MTEQADGTILVIDDEKNIRRTLAMVLEGEGFEVLDAPTAEDGLRVLARRKVDAVVLDVSLPGMDGLTALRHILDDDRDLPVVMISGHASIQDAVEATRIGAFDFLEKPLGLQKLLSTIERSLKSDAVQETLRVSLAALGASTAIRESARGLVHLLAGRRPILVLG